MRIRDEFSVTCIGMDALTKGTLIEVVDGVTHRAQWFVDNQAVVLHVESSEPLGGMLVGLLIGGIPDSVAIRLFQEYIARAQPRPLRA
jgi:hypothetical protein